MNELTFLVNNEEDLIILRNNIKKLAADRKMSLINQTKLMTAASELGRNMIRYGHGGRVTVVLRQEPTRTGIQMTFTDQGPGIANLEQAMTNGYSTSRGLGLGLPGTKRLMDEFHIESTVGQGTMVRVTKW